MKSKTVFHEQAFVIKNEDLKKIDSLFKKFNAEPEYSVETVDGFRTTYYNLDDVLNLENPSSNSIERVKISGRSANPSWQAWIIFGKGRIANIRYSITIEDRINQMISELIGTRIEAVKPWYSRLSRTDFISYTMAMFSGAIIVSWLLIAIGFFETSGEEITTEEDALVKLLTVLIIGAVFGLGWLLNKFRSKFFPIGTFAIGQGLRRYEVLEKIRWVFLSVLGSIFFGWIASLIASLIA